MSKICILFLMTVLVLSFNVAAQEAASVKAGETVQVSTPSAPPPPDQEKVQELKEYFEPLQNNPQYFVDRKMRKPANPQDIKKLKDYKPNFGKKIWVKSWELDDIKQKKDLFGQLIEKKNYKISAIEVAEDVSKYLNKELANTNIDIDTWAKRIEEFGRTYVNPDNAGKKLCNIVVADFQNGNYLQIEATKSFNDSKMCYFIGEEYDVIIKSLLKYKTRKQRGEKE